MKTSINVLCLLVLFVLINCQGQITETEIPVPQVQTPINVGMPFTLTRLLQIADTAESLFR